MIRTGHVVAAFIGVVFAAYINWKVPSQHAGALPTVLWVSVFFGALWECIVRLWKLLQGVHDRRAHK